MLKRTNGYILLFLLVITGIAGRISPDTLSSKERRFLTSELKDSRAFFLKSVKGLSEAQLNFRPGPDKWSVKECILHIALGEETLWKMAEAAIKSPVNPEKRKEIATSDTAFLNNLKNRSQKFKAPEGFRPEEATWKTAGEALEAFKDRRNTIIRFAKTTTDDLRNHVTESGSMDAYQVLLLIAGHTSRHTLQIEEVKKDPGFPKN